MGSFRRHKWEERGRPKALYYDESCKDAPILPQFPVPICDCGRPVGVRQSRHEDTAARAYYCCNDYRIDGPDKVDLRYLLFDVWIHAAVDHDHFH